jgi:hypothetical protein
MSLASDLRRFARLTEAKQERVVKQSFIQLGNEMEFKSPVKSGAFKASWIGAVGSIDEDIFAPGRDAVGSLSAMLQGFRVGQVFYYTNSQPYALRLEFGHSEQAANGMVRLTARNWPRIVNQNIRANQ